MEICFHSSFVRPTEHSTTRNEMENLEYIVLNQDRQVMRRWDSTAYIVPYV